MSRTLTIIIPYWHGAQFLPACLESIAGSVFDADVHCSVVIVHNGGSDPVIPPTLDMQVEILRTAENIGFARAVNVGLQHALRLKSDLIAILNQDTRVSATCFQALITAATDAQACYAPLILNEDMTAVPAWYAEKYYPQGVKTYDQELCELSTMSGTCVLWSHTSLLFGGFFDPEFYMYYEDDDYFDRFRSRGGKLFVVPSAQVGHISGSTESEDGSRLWKRMGLLKFYSRHRSRWALSRKLIRHYGGAIYKGDFRRFAGYVRNDLKMLTGWNYLRHASHEQIHARALNQISQDEIHSS